MFNQSQIPTNDTSDNSNSTGQIKEVWNDNLEEEFKVINEQVERYNYVAMDTEYPGIYSAFQADNTNKEAGYRFIKSNVDQLKLIQVGITLCDENGDLPSPIATWQFNFKFNISTDKYCADSINLLKDAGIDFKSLNDFGINPLQFADQLLSSGMVQNDEVKWITFHGSFDFAYLVKNLLYQPLPNTMDDFMSTLRMFFPTIYDLKIIVSEMHDIKNGSQSKLAMDLDLKRTGTQHQAGSDSHQTLLSFFKIRKNFFKEGFAAKIINKIYGLSNETGIYHQTVYTGLDAQNNYVYPYLHLYIYVWAGYFMILNIFSIILNF